MARLTGFADGITITPSWAIVRAVGGVIAADNTSLIDANIAPASGLDCGGYDTILVAAEITAGTNPTATIEPLFRDQDAVDGSRWKRPLLGAPPGVTLGAVAAQMSTALGPLDVYEFRVFGHPLIFLRINAVTNSGSTTNINILVRGGVSRPIPRRR